VTTRFRAVPPEPDWRAFKLRHHKGGMVFAQGQPVYHWFEILSGVVRTSHIKADGNRRVTGFFFNGDVLGVESGLRTETAEALSDTLLLGHPLAATESTTSPVEIPFRRALRCAQSTLFLVGRSSASERIAAFFASIATRLGSTDRVPLPMSRDDIADHLGLTSHTVSRTIMAFERYGVVTRVRRDELRVLRPDILLALAGERDLPADCHANAALRAMVRPGDSAESLTTEAIATAQPVSPQDKAARP
jgi:CRP/FNR family nitrogen fixation transcriptional regulator